MSLRMNSTRSFPMGGFTLVELLVVIGIISLLAAIILPVFATVRESGRKTVCQSNLRQIGMAYALYAQDNDDKFAWGGDPTDLFTNSWAGDEHEAIVKTLKPLPDVLFLYTQNRDIWHCPSDKGLDFTGPGESIPLSAHPTSFGKYGNSYYSRTSLALNQERFGTLKGTLNDENTGKSLEFGSAEIGYIYDGSGDWHGGGVGSKRYNALHSDGHVKDISRETFDRQWSMGLGS